MNEIALVIGGSDAVLTEFDAAAQICHRAGVQYVTFVVNDLIATFPQVDHAVTLHPAKIDAMWLLQRRKERLPFPERVWAHRFDKMMAPSVTDACQQWTTGSNGGSSGLLAVKIALQLGYGRVVLCGVPMTMKAGHINRKQPWVAVRSFVIAWEARHVELKPHVRSMSGFTMELFGTPTMEFLQHALDTSDLDFSALDRANAGGRPKQRVVGQPFKR